MSFTLHAAPTLLPVDRPEGYATRVTMVLAGLFVLGASDAFVLASGAGVSPWPALVVGLAGVTGTPVGVVTAVTGLLFVVAAWALGAPVGRVAVAAPVVCGVAFEAASAFLGDPGTFGRLLFAVVGVAGFGIGLGVYLGAGIGRSALDRVIGELADRAGWSLPVGLGVFQAVCVAVSLGLGGPVGPLTFVFPFAGPLLIGVCQRAAVRVTSRRSAPLRTVS
jgi:uncharacterized membrane protein YczE